VRFERGRAEGVHWICGCSRPSLVDELGAVAASAYTGTYRISATSQGGPADSALYGPGEVRLAACGCGRRPHFRRRVARVNGPELAAARRSRRRGDRLPGVPRDWNGTAGSRCLFHDSDRLSRRDRGGSPTGSRRLPPVPASIAGAGIFRTNRDVGRVGNLQLTGPVTENSQAYRLHARLTWAAPESPSEPIVG
jgi:hypothetical protein